MHRIPVGVIGASGYAGRQLCALVLRHPQLALAFASANDQRGTRAELPLGGSVDFIATDDAPLAAAELVFSALPHGTSKIWVTRARAAGAKVVDLSSDLRVGNEGAEPSVPYGLTELHRTRIQAADVVANPGCYATAVLLGLLPVLEENFVADDAVINVNAASGVTGAGLSPRTDLMFGEVTESFRAYGIGNTHRHVAEMRATIRDLGSNADVVFTPHLLPVARGILATMTVPLRAPLADVGAPWRERYGNEPFIELASQAPELRHVTHRNTVRIHVVSVAYVRQPTLLVLAAIDNLLKGAAGQALQNANLMLGLGETAGLPA